MWRNDRSGSTIPASSKRTVRLRQDGKCAVVDARVCTGEIVEFVHVTNVASLRIERSHANDPALLQGLCAPCLQVKAQHEAQAARRRNLQPPQEHPGLAPRVDDTPGRPLVRIKEN